MNPQIELKAPLFFVLLPFLLKDWFPEFQPDYTQKKETHKEATQRVFFSFYKDRKKEEVAKSKTLSS
jgi:hypothetical protein